jgi:sRNA-binding carbon storage regulator CsrA
MLRMYRNQNQEITIKKRNSPNDVDEYIRVKILDIDLHTGRVEVGVQATQAWNIYRAESPRDDNHEDNK